MSDKKQTTHLATRAIHAGQQPDPSTGAIMTPIYQTSTFVQDGVARPRNGYEYARMTNPTRTALEANLAALEGGVAARAFGSGLAAMEAVLKATLSAGDRVVAVAASMAVDEATSPPAAPPMPSATSRRCRPAAAPPNSPNVASTMRYTSMSGTRARPRTWWKP